VPMSRRSLLRLLAGGSALVTLAGAAACSAQASGSSTAKPPVSTLLPGQPGYFGGTDLAWVEITIAMDEQLLPLLALSKGQAGTAAVAAFSDQVQEFTDQELASLRALHDQAKLPSTNPHEGMLMPGMVTAEQVTQAKATSSGKAFDTLLVKLVRAHIAQSVSLADSEVKAGVEPQTLALAKQVLSTRAKGLAQLKVLPLA
jgi:uncharacterized protein (DUF305 family)